MPASTQEKLPLIPKVMPKWFWPLVILLCLSFTGFVSTLCITMMVRRNSDPVKQAIALAAKDARVAALGQPLEAGFLVVGDSKKIDGTERCYWQFNLKGPNGSGILRVNAVRVQDEEWKPPGAWQVQYLDVYLPAQGNEMITLVGDPEHPPENFNTPKKEEKKEDAKDGKKPEAQVAPAAAKPGVAQ